LQVRRRSLSASFPAFSDRCAFHLSDFSRVLLCLCAKYSGFGPHMTRMVGPKVYLEQAYVNAASCCKSLCVCADRDLVAGIGRLSPSAPMIPQSACTLSCTDKVVPFLHAWQGGFFSVAGSAPTNPCWPQFAQFPLLFACAELPLQQHCMCKAVLCFLGCAGHFPAAASQPAF
jgi:hypothetical protein